MPKVTFTTDLPQNLVDDLKRQWAEGCQIILSPNEWKCFDEHPPIVLGGRPEFDEVTLETHEDQA
jgi:hypothetical protein